MGIQDAIAELSTVLGQRLTRSKSDLDLHGRSETHFPTTPPDAVAYPETTDEVAQIVRTCARHLCPVVGWGTGTSLEGQAQAFHGGICVDFQQMNRVLDIRTGDMDVRVQPGVTREALNEELRATGLFFPVDPGANASLGGMASTRASGTTAVRYGTMRDNVLGLEVVTAAGEVIRTGSRARKSSSGYDLTGLFVGAEGTLGLITELTLRLRGQPEAIASAVCAFETVGDAVAATTDAIQIGLPIARIELVDTASVAAVNAYSGSILPEKPHLLLEFHGTDSGVAEQSGMFGEIARDHNGSGFDWATRTEDRTALWAMRHNAYHAILAARPGARAIVTDICVPISNLAQAIEETRADLAENSVQGPILGHVGDGNFHAILLIDPDDPVEMAQANEVSDRMVKRALQLGGTATGEHGVGVGKLKFMQDEHGGGWAVMGALKQALDPDNIMNPGKLVPPRN
ncbi:putative FAD-linked oxidoreductase [Roseovarius litorisediminis]|uniref:D-lactate dehydrogenase (cytochrome) n=1 Tax=Roseovarius litorisediminis TaxID=1312363 RepID=A0A1Y5TF72_9RHOB|nr:FAD-linked oxidase C-terminal domain-containing protein [Roseovarius litorisediminis]SLN60529.1 putative FAD-linked oxidoreductase [Roseovarius litorisediminis]